MRSKLLLIALSTAALGACTTPEATQADRGLASVHIPVVTTADYVFDAAAPGGALAQGEGERLSGWFQGLGLGYGDTIYVDSAAPAARAQVASIAGHFGMLVTPGAPATAGMREMTCPFCDTATAPELERQLAPVLAGPVKDIVFDLAQLKFISSAGLRVFSTTRKTLKERGGQASFIHMQPQIQEVFDIMKSLPGVAVFKNVAELDAYLAARQRSHLNP